MKCYGRMGQECRNIDDFNFVSIFIFMWFSNKKKQNNVN